MARVLSQLGLWSAEHSGEVLSGSPEVHATSIVVTMGAGGVADDDFSLPGTTPSAALNHLGDGFSKAIGMSAHSVWVATGRQRPDPSDIAAAAAAMRTGTPR